MSQTARKAVEVSDPDMVVRPLGPVMGAEITGLDIAQPMSQETFQALEALFIQYKLLCFRDQALSIPAQVAFTKLWGTPLEHTMAGHVQDGPGKEVQVASNVGPDGKPNGKHPDVTAMRWHTDRSWRPDPALATLLYGIEVPGTGGDTLFCNTAMAYANLPEEVKQRVDPMRVIHSVEYSRRTADGPPATEYELRIGPPTPHPCPRARARTAHPPNRQGSHESR